jgi:DnaJ domain
MPAKLAAKTQDHYALLGIDPHSVAETMYRAYATLAHKYHPENPLTGNAEMFESLNLAYEVLSDPLRRRAFDELQGIGQEEGGPRFSGIAFFNGLQREEVLRSAILCLLYDRRRTRPSAPGVSMRAIEIMVDATAVELSLALWYLKQRGLAASDDKSSLHITVDGMDFLNSKKPSPEDVMAIIKPASIASVRTQPPQIHPGASPLPAPNNDSVLSTLHRALARTSD